MSQLQGLNLPEENIYFLGQRRESPQQKESRYRSKFRERVRQESKDGHRTFGFPLEPLHPPSDFLRKRSRSASIRTEAAPRDHNHYEVRLKAALDNRGGKIVHHSVDHLRENIRRAETAKPRRPVTCAGPSQCDTHHGDFFALERSGLVPKYVRKPSFGSVPQYIVARRREANLREQQKQEQLRDEERGQQVISEAQRMELLVGLRTNWNALQQAYKKMSLLTDTLPKKARKTQMENEMKQIEKDILFLEKHRFIAIDD